VSAFQPSTDDSFVKFLQLSQFPPSGHRAGTKHGAGELELLGKSAKGKTMHRKAIRYVNRSTAAAAGAVATAATSVAAAAVAASIIFSPVADASARMDGVSQDLLRAVELNQITEEQAVKFEARLAGRIFGEA